MIFKLYDFNHIIMSFTQKRMYIYPGCNFVYSVHWALNQKIFQIFLK